MTKPETINILLVDDQPGKLLTYEAILQGLGENLIKAGSAREALEFLLKTDIAIVLMDVCMPDVDGFELAALIRQHPRCQRTAIILVSAIMMTDFDRLKGFEHGAVDYLSVPVVPEILRAKVAVFADLYRKTKQLERLNYELEERVALRTADLEASTLRLRESESRHRLTLESALDCVVTMNQEGVLVGFNSAAERTFGYRRDDVIGRLLADVLIPPQFRERHRQGLAHLLETGESTLLGRRVELPAIRADGTEFPAELSISTIKSPTQPDEVLFTAFLRDITERKQAQDEKSSLLASERAARTDAERANRFKDRFLATVSHELRTPLNGVLLWVQLLRRNPKDQAALAEGLESIERGGRAQARLIEDLLDMNRIVSGKMRLELQTVDLRAIVDSAIATLRPVADSKAIKLDLKLNPLIGSVRGDPSRLQQIVWNLFSNAVKFTPKGGEVHVELTQRGSQVEICIRDSGRGIPCEFLPHVFASFHQADSSTTRHHGGLGLGLAITKHLVELHDGVVEVTSAGEGHGTTARVTLPIEAAPAQPRPLPQPLPEVAPKKNGLSKARILVVDDDPDSCDILRRILISCDATVEVSASADDALSKLESFRPNVLLSDIGLPGKDGYDLIRDIRKREPESERNLPAIAVTAFARPEDRAHAIQAGFDMYVSKPVDQAKLLEMLSILLHDGRPD